ncbi:exodeoxyribonuclease III [Clostridiales bacterium COT073_COT-073]|nr:exodeoxyribonuclease III [Clostridiales bacterium COT073_COT-073]
MKQLISWNVNGIRACVGKGFYDYFQNQGADFFCLQETKIQPEQIELDLPGYHQYFNYAKTKKGYSGTAIFCKEKPLSVTYDIGVEEHDQEGRVITAEMEEFYLVTVYTPNSKRELERLDDRMNFEDAFRAYLHELNQKKPVIVCGDLNVAHQEIDLANPKSNRRNAGFTDEERNKMTLLLESGFTDSFRFLYPDKTEAYSWWSYFGKARERNVGWRIDYFLVSDDFKTRIVDAEIHMDVQGSDHCPVVLYIS